MQVTVSPAPSTATRWAKVSSGRCSDTMARAHLDALAEVAEALRLAVHRSPAAGRPAAAPIIYRHRCVTSGNARPYLNQQSKRVPQCQRQIDMQPQ